MPVKMLPSAAADRMPWVIARVHKQLVAVHASGVRELSVQPESTPVPRAPEWIRGVMNWRGKIIPCLDLRRRLALPDAMADIDELCGIITARAADHQAWLEELARSVEERRPFSLTTDPHACAFGRWYDNYRTDNLIVAGLLRKMDAPHKAIHAVGVRVEQLKAEGKFDEAARLIDSHRNTTLQRLLDLFIGFEAAVKDSYRPVAIVLEVGGTLIALLADSIEAVETLDPATVESLEEKGVESNSDLVLRVAQRSRGQGSVGLIESDRLLPGLASTGVPEAA
jgi:chemotaxis signal transduction protein